MRTREGKMTTNWLLINNQPSLPYARSWIITNWTSAGLKNRGFNQIKNILRQITSQITLYYFSEKMFFRGFRFHHAPAVSLFQNLRRNIIFSDEELGERFEFLRWKIRKESLSVFRLVIDSKTRVYFDNYWNKKWWKLLMNRWQYLEIFFKSIGNCSTLVL